MRSKTGLLCCLDLAMSRQLNWRSYGIYTMSSIMQGTGQVDEVTGSKKVYLYRNSDGIPSGAALVGLVSVDEAVRIQVISHFPDTVLSRQKIYTMSAARVRWPSAVRFCCSCPCSRCGS